MRIYHVWIFNANWWIEIPLKIFQKEIIHWMILCLNDCVLNFKRNLAECWINSRWNGSWNIIWYWFEGPKEWKIPKKIFTPHTAIRPYNYPKQLKTEIILFRVFPLFQSGIDCVPKSKVKRKENFPRNENSLQQKRFWWNWEKSFIAVNRLH